MTDDQFTKLFKLVQDTAAETRRDFAEQLTGVKAQVNGVYDLLSKNIAEHQRQEEERAAMSHQLSRHDAYFSQIEDHTGVELRHLRECGYDTIVNNYKKILKKTSVREVF